MTDTPPPAGLLLCDDLIFASRVLGTARAHGLAVAQARTFDQLLTRLREIRPACVVIDLATPGLDLLYLFEQLSATGGPAPRVVAYGSHVDAESLRAARAAGCDPAWPRSKFAEELERALPTWFSTAAGA